MPKKSPAAECGAGFLKSPGRDAGSLSKNRPHKQPNTRPREAFCVVISRGLWRGIDVMVEPPVARHRMRHFSDRDAAQAHAEELTRVTGWPILDRTGGAS
jgi:hypothetical protein